MFVTEWRGVKGYHFSVLFGWDYTVQIFPKPAGVGEWFWSWRRVWLFLTHSKHLWHFEDDAKESSDLFISLLRCRCKAFDIGILGERSVELWNSYFYWVLLPYQFPNICLLLVVSRFGYNGLAVILKRLLAVLFRIFSAFPRPGEVLWNSKRFKREWVEVVVLDATS